MKFVGFTPIPDRITRLVEIAYNLWWTWHPEAQELFRRIDAQLWEDVYHNPILFLREVRQSSVEKASNDPDFIRAYHQVLTRFDEYQLIDDTWFKKTHPDKIDKPIAYFSAEFGLHISLPIYSGGLGVLAGDFVKSASDLRLPVVGVGLLYQKGYFRQYLNADGWQQETYPDNDFHNLPVVLERDENSSPLTIEVMIRFISAPCSLHFALCFSSMPPFVRMAGKTPFFLGTTNCYL